jgi:hypothetical protein
LGGLFVFDAGEMKGGGCGWGWGGGCGRQGRE